MLSWTNMALSALLSLTLTVTAEAQSPSMTVGPGDVLTAGGSANITYHDPSSPGTSILVEIHDGTFPFPNTQYISVNLDAEGWGTVSWSVPETWPMANFMAPGVSYIVMPITSGGGGGGGEE